MSPSFELAVIATGLVPEAADEAGAVVAAGGCEDAFPPDDPHAASTSAPAAASATTPPNRAVTRVRFGVVDIIVLIALSSIS
jgi:hypothetical protein